MHTTMCSHAVMDQEVDNMNYGVGETRGKQLLVCKSYVQ